jgi:hypothetical protein
VRAVVYDSWPLMRHGKTGNLAVEGLNGIYAALQTVTPKSPQEVAFYNDSITQLGTALAARQDRLQSVAGGIPSIIMVLLSYSTPW